MSLLPHGPSSKECLSLLYKAFFWPLLTYASHRWLPFVAATNFTKIERLYQTANCAISSCLSSSPIPLFISETSLSPLQVTLTHFALSFFEQALRLPTSFPTSGLARLGVKIRPCRSLWGAFASTHRSCFLLLFLGRLLLLALFLFFVTCLSSLWSPPFPLCAPALIPSLSPMRSSHSP